MKIVIAGGSGFIGTELTNLLLQEGHEVIILTRRAKESDGRLSYVEWLHSEATPEKEIGTADAFVNLAGVSINNGRWTEEHQQQIYESRMTATDELLRIIHELPQKPSVLVNASAIGIYPASETVFYTETSDEVAPDFLGQTVRDWENKASSVKEIGVRTVFTRFGVVLGKDEGALPLMVLPYRLFAGGKVGSGRQWLSWVHVTDVARAMAFAIAQEGIQGPVNVTSPFPKRMDDFGKTIGETLTRPHWLPVPSFAMKMALGKKSALVLEGQHVLPEVLQQNGFTFKFPLLKDALQNLLHE
ncbi:TIGR01777 family oxidoreductase [Sporosarcina sp. 179-K 3D1 HS]|uniref:TIGR01777 family oxidoreductase n=1 Tax=Sporosarcina sp. 179-K 3D1 HS TaxID=3232169 RepID=UPI0039A2074C